MSNIPDQSLTVFMPNVNKTQKRTNILLLSFIDFRIHHESLTMICLCQMSKKCKR